VRLHAIPPRAVPKTDETYFEVLTQAVFQAGFSWEVVRTKWPHVRKAFKAFNIPAVARFDIRDVDRLLKDPGLVRNRKKIQATIENARTLQALVREQGSVKQYAKSLRKYSYAQKVRELSSRFRYLGPTGVFFFLWCVGEDVPRWQERDPDRPPTPRERPARDRRINRRRGD
jgi:DNA-3-methyladenine glycosylase I